MISKDICGMVMRYAYQHVTVTTESQLRRLVEAPLNERVGEWFGQTVRCDVLLPFAVSAAGIRTLVSRCAWVWMVIMSNTYTSIGSQI